MSEIEIKVDLDLDSKKAKNKLDDFKQMAEKEEVKVKLDLDNVKGDALKLKNILSDSFKLDSKTLGNLKQVEESLKQINKLIKSQSEISKKGNSKGLDLGINPISIKKNSDIVKDVSVLVDDQQKAAKQLESLDKIGKSMKEALDSFNNDQEDAFKKFSQDSKSYDTYLKDLKGDNITKAMKKAIDARKKAIELQEELTKHGVVKVNNDQLRNETIDGSIFTIENEKWKAMFAKSESEANDLENMARKLQPKILKANAQVEELMKKMSEGERKLLNEFTKSYEQRPKFDKFAGGMDNDNISTIRMYLENMMPDIDKMGLDFDNVDDIFRGLNRFYSRLEQMQNEYNTKFSKGDLDKLRLDSLVDIDQDVAKKVIQDLEKNTEMLDNALKEQYTVLNRDYGDGKDITISGVNEKEIARMKEYIRLSELMNKAKKSSGSSLSPGNAVSEYLALSKAIDSIQTKLYKAGNEGKDASKLSKELELLEQKRNKLNQLVDINSEYMQQELRLQQARQDSDIANIDSNEKTKALKEEQRLRKQLAQEDEKLRKNAYAQRNKDVKEYLQATKKIGELETQIYKNDKSGETDTNKELEKQISLLRERQAVLSMDIRSNGDLTDDIKKQIEYQEKLQKAIQETKRVSVNEKADNKATQQLEKAYKELDKIQDKLTSMQNTKGFLDNAMVEKTNSLLAETRNKLDADGIESDFKGINSAISTLGNNLQSLNSGNTLNRQEANFNTSLQNMENKLKAFKDSIRHLEGSDDIIRRLETSFRNIDTSNIERATVELRQFGNGLQQAEREMRRVSSTSRSFFGNFGQEFRDNLFTFTAGELLADGIRNVGYALKTIVKEYDQSMSNLKKVADVSDIMSTSQLDAIQSKAVGIAKNVGMASQDVIQAIADTIQMGGYGMEEATKVAEQTMMLANVAEMTQEAASKGVVTMMSAFDLDPMKEIPVVVDGVVKSTDELTNSMDMLNHVGNTQAISSSGILNAIQSGANVLAEYNVSMADTIAMISASNTTLQNPEKVG